MIVKHVPMKTVRKSNFRDLAQYLSDPKDRGERVGDIRITNCHADEWTDAAPDRADAAIAGGSFKAHASEANCEDAVLKKKEAVDPLIGFRCCKDLHE